MYHIYSSSCLTLIVVSGQSPRTFSVGLLAQLVEQGIFNPKVTGSIPVGPTKTSLNQ